MSYVTGWLAGEMLALGRDQSDVDGDTAVSLAEDEQKPWHKGKGQRPSR
jgi:hypothetical protein